MLNHSPIPVKSFYTIVTKPVFDFAFSLLIFLLLSPLFILIALLLSFTNGGTPFFFQLRPGKNEQVFKLIKFKTMNNKKDSDGNLLPDENRLTKLGMLIRKTSLDEIPQLVNVIKGDMSIIGPRPLLVEYLPLYNDIQKKRHLVKPGITGWAQVNGRNAIGWGEKFEYDIYYIERVCLRLDIKILLLTLKKLIKPEGISAVGHATMQKFTGSE